MSDASLHTLVDELLTQPLTAALDPMTPRARSLWSDFIASHRGELPTHLPGAFAAAIWLLLPDHTLTREDLALHYGVEGDTVRAALHAIRDTLDLSPFDPRYASPPANPMMQQLAGLLFEVCEASRDPLDGTLKLPQIPTTWTLLTLTLPRDTTRDDTLVSLVDNHTRFVLDQRMVERGELSPKIAVDMMVSVMHKSGIRPDDIMIQDAHVARTLHDRLERVEIASQLTDGAHLEELTASFSERFSEVEELLAYFADDLEALPTDIASLHAHVTTFWELRPWEHLGEEVMLDFRAEERAWLVSVLDARGGRFGFTVLDVSEEETTGTQHILALTGCEQFDIATLAALESAGLEPIGEDYFPLLITSQESPATHLDYTVTSALCEGLNAFVSGGRKPVTLDLPTLGALHVSIA